jgi:hypothetical protein
MEYVFYGKVWYQDDPPTGSCGLMIGEKNVVSDIYFPAGTKVNCGIADDRFDGDLFIESGWGYSEWTVMESDTLMVGPHNMLDIIGRYEGKEIIFFISDGPIDILGHLTTAST